MAACYRYAEKKYNDALSVLGNVRVGTLHDFRRKEHKKGIADANEGKKTVYHLVEYASSEKSGIAHLEAIKNFGGIQWDKGAGPTFRNVSLSREFNVPDCFVHCSSFDYSRTAMSQFDGADSCVEIFDVNGFYRRLTEAIGVLLPVELLDVRKVVYTERLEQWNGKSWGVHPALIKEPFFSPQVEVRAIWRPLFSGPIAPVVVSDVGLIRFCRSKPVPE